jgi:hypothetical protein
MTREEALKLVQGFNAKHVDQESMEVMSGIEVLIKDEIRRLLTGFEVQRVETSKRISRDNEDGTDYEVTTVYRINQRA